MAELVDDATACTSVEVGVPPDRAFEMFTAEIGSWWDADKHILRSPLAEMVFEPFVGGHIIDRGTDGSECRWARVLAYEPPRRVVFSWDIDVRWQIETDPDRCSEVEIRFEPLAESATRVELTHRHLDRHGPGWESMRDAVAGGWSLEGFARYAARDPGGDSVAVSPDGSVVDSVGEPVVDSVGEPVDSVGDPLRPLPTITDETMRARLGQAKPYTAALLFATEKFVRPDVDAIVWEHGRRNMALVEAGELLVVLPVTDDSELAGLGVFGGDAERVRAILDGDPGVRAGIFRYELHAVRGFPGATLR
ncbi:MAG TPA: SRPBCC family protein [Solirubrobacteraceae bacterium]|nr:SRPBCC family protein [Solirubrobacteraceae bacterium]